MSAQIKHSNLYLTQARSSLSAQDRMKIYDKWAATYNDEATVKSSDNPAKSGILDAGCGTGLVGQALASAGAEVIDGYDLSAAMLMVVDQIDVYRSLAQGDLAQRIGKADDTYDIMTCVGTFTSGHVGLILL
ncbi:3dde78a8-afca-41a4-97d1-09da9a8a1a71 [Sclerotinia trifoliorum]|uniref:3dde78a8-afca-41a4-97d1-09da9a8a1a71 n=1 Tax=Sclerotinia trifoliorum TaxID=28548 RepID=A0A8H2ZNY2_9HELO|nr:3dde78a8-afca-41a4-97d1-09da9a8a1a71 [Sclerotinia trifoliorum]